MIASFHLSSIDWGILIVCSFLIGMAKVGVPGVSMVVIPALAMIFGGKQSTGIILPMLIMADIFGVSYYHRHAHWKHVLRALPWALSGIMIAMFVGNRVSDKQFKQIIAAVIFASIAFMIWRDRSKNASYLPSKWYFAAAMGLGGGFATMIGNAAGPILAIYLLALRLPKNEFIGTAAWFFFVINLMKFPLHVISWKTINWGTLLIDIATLPSIAIGAFIGIWLVKKISGEWYRWLVIGVTILSAVIMLF